MASHLDESLHPVREFLLQVEKTLTTRKLYEPHMAPYREASQRLLDRFTEAAGDGGIELGFGPSDLYFDKKSVLKREQGEESFFFPLYRDGLREMTLRPGLNAEELDALLSAFEVERKGLLSPTEDTVSYLWRCELEGVDFKAIDGLGDEESVDGSEVPLDEYRALVGEVLAKIQDPAPAVGGQGYAMILDADVRVAASDLRYETTTVHRAFEENPTVMQLSAQEAGAVRREVERDDEGELLEQFEEILFHMLRDPQNTRAGESLTPVFEKLLDGYWRAVDFEALVRLLNGMALASREAAEAVDRRAAQRILEGFLTDERVAATFEGVKEGRLPPHSAFPLWDLRGDEVWVLVLDLWWSLPGSQVRDAVKSYVQGRLGTHPDLLRGPLGAGDAERVRAALTLIDEDMEAMYAQELLALAAHREESIRLKAVAAAGRLGGEQGLEVVWRAMEHDPAKAVRLLAFRLVADLRHPQLARRILGLVSEAEFAARPLWERDKYVRLLGTVAADSVRPMFESWIPTKRWLWQPHDYEAAELALGGLVSCGGEGVKRVEEVAGQGGKLGEIAQRVLASRSTG